MNILVSIDSKKKPIYMKQNDDYSISFDNSYKFSRIVHENRSYFICDIPKGLVLVSTLHAIIHEFGYILINVDNMDDKTTNIICHLFRSHLIISITILQRKYHLISIK